MFSVRTELPGTCWVRLRHGYFKALPPVFVHQRFGGVGPEEICDVVVDGEVEFSFGEGGGWRWGRVLVG